jgi:hypothetical protein
MYCRACKGTLDPFLGLGSLQLTGYLAPDEERRPSIPLTLCACSDCRLVQLQVTAPRELLFERYWYQSGINETMRAELADIADHAIAWVTPQLQPGDVVIDIGANDGTLLAAYKGQPYKGHPFTKVTRVAFEPAKNLRPALASHAELIISDYFPQGYQEIRAWEGQVQIITSIAMFYAVDKLHPFLAAISALLAPHGVWIVQLQDLDQMLRATAFDNICHEHLCYYTLGTFETLIAPYGLQVSHVTRRAINGGSLRFYVQHAGHLVSPSVPDQRAREQGCDSWASLEAFARSVEQVKAQIRAALALRRKHGQTIDLYGASTKANTLLQVCGLNRLWLRQAWERSADKVGRRTVGTEIPIVSEETGREKPPDALLVGIWQFREALLQREKGYLAGGGTLIFPLPKVDVVTWSEAHRAHA